jgi:chaperonin GroES
MPLRLLSTYLQGTVVAVGPGARTPDGKVLEMPLKVGDKVLLPEYGGQKLKLDDEDFLLYQDNDILGTIQ